MQNYNVKLESQVFTTYRCQRAANSLDIDVAKKSVHELNIKADLTSPFGIGLIVGASGSGKTTLAKKIFGEDVFKSTLKDDISILDQFPENMPYDDCASVLTGIGLTSVPCWIRPVYTLSNGQRARAEAALSMTLNKDLTVLDEWTSVVDRTVAKVMSHCVSKFAKKQNKKIILLSCHYDVIEWLDPDWIIDCNKQEFIDRRSLRPEDRKRKEKLEFTIKSIDSKSWKYFSKYHYLSERIPGGKNYYFGLFHHDEQVGFICFSNYVPYKDEFKKKGRKKIYHFNRLVVHPDYAGFGLGIHFANATSKIMQKDFDVRVKLSSAPLVKALLKSPDWKILDAGVKMTKDFSNRIGVNLHTRTRVKTYSFKYVGAC